jgi:hypothetical protein
VVRHLRTKREPFTDGVRRRCLRLLSGLVVVAQWRMAFFGNTSIWQMGFNGTLGLSNANRCCDVNGNTLVVREYEEGTDYCEAESHKSIFCHKRSASGVYSQRAILRRTF